MAFDAAEARAKKLREGFGAPGLAFTADTHETEKLAGHARAYHAPSRRGSDRVRRLTAALRRQTEAMEIAPQAGGWLHGALSSTARILTPDGPRAIGALSVGDMVETKDKGPQPVRWIGHTPLTVAQLAANPAICPVRIRPGALGEGFPRKTLEISPAEQLVMCSLTPEAEECLVCAAALTRREGILRALPRAGFAYVQLMFDAHQILLVEGIEVESFHPEVLRPTSADRAIWSEVLAVFPDLEHGMDMYGPRARPALVSRAQS